MKKVLVLHGPNINLTGIREPGTYGKQTLEQINKSIGCLLYTSDAADEL